MRKILFFPVTLVLSLMCTGCSDDNNDIGFKPKDIDHKYDFIMDIALNNYSFNPFEKELEWEEFEYNVDNPADNRIIYYSLSGETSPYGRSLYRDGIEIGRISTDGLYNVFYTPVGKNESYQLYDFKDIIDATEGVYYKCEYGDGSFGKFDQSTQYIGYGGYTVIDRDKYNVNPDDYKKDVLCYAKNNNDDCAIAGVGYIDGILRPHETIKKGYKRLLIQFAFKQDKTIDNWHVLYVFPIKYTDDLADVSGVSYKDLCILVEHIPSGIWKQEFIFSLQLLIIY